jgi:hypothetical protein
VAAFERVLEALAEELIESTDDELLEAARDLGMDPTMRGSAAFIGLKYPALPRPSDFFELPATLPPAIHAGRHSSANHRLETQSPARRKRRKPRSDGDEGT